MINSIFLTICFVLCFEQNNYFQKNQLLKEIFNSEYKIDAIPKDIFVLNGLGCSNCNKIYYEFLNYIELRKDYVIVLGNNNQLDLNDFNKINKGHIIYDYRNLLYRKKIIGNNPAYIKYTVNEIDTIINLLPNNIEQDLLYIRNNL